MPARLPVPMAVLAMFALVTAVPAAADPSPANAVCSTGTAPADGAIVHNLTVTSECVLDAVSVTVTGNVNIDSAPAVLRVRNGATLTIAGNLDLTRGNAEVSDGGSVHLAGNVSGNPGVLQVLGSPRPTGVTVGGNLTLRGDSMLTAQPTDSSSGDPAILRVAGNVTATGVTNIRLIDITGELDNIVVGGRTAVSGQTGELTVVGAALGPATVSHTAASIFTIVYLDSDLVAGSLDLVDNATGNGTIVAGNHVTGSLGCAGNIPAPTSTYGGIAHPNTVDGAETGQCAGL